MKSLVQFILENMKFSKISLKESKWDPDYIKQVITVHLDTIYNDGYDRQQDAQKALKELIKDGDCEMLDFLIDSIYKDDEDNVSYDDIYAHYDEFVKMAQDVAKEWE